MCFRTSKCHGTVFFSSSTYNSANSYYRRSNSLRTNLMVVHSHRLRSPNFGQRNVASCGELLKYGIIVKLWLSSTHRTQSYIHQLFDRIREIHTRFVLRPLDTFLLRILRLHWHCTRYMEPSIKYIRHFGLTGIYVRPTWESVQFLPFHLPEITETRKIAQDQRTSKNLT